ncbi:hypothetical protein LAZ67_1002645 [Cordylochernes scorpioides]|uniref:Transposase n=1 Tax=Cordylochernes scorpioides TaxID=51811 RepID=A0ABY6K110_9ARAC|nr:hypothetical protein LAZ67_1002645 [Cordylochernes scorpioides]
MLQKAFKDDCISRSQSGKWHKAFKEGREEVADEPRSGRPTTARTDEDVDRVLEVLRTDRRLSIQQIADTLHMSTFVVHGIVTEDMQMRKSCAWHTKSSLRPKKARMSKSRIKTMIIVFFDIRGIVHCEFVPQGQTVNSAFYLEVLRRLKRRIASVRTDIKDTVKLHHDNATSHTAFIITNFLAQSNTPAFKEGREEVADEPRSGRPTTARTDEDVDRVLEVLRTDRRLSIQQIADTLHMSTFVVHGIVTEDMQMRKLDLIQNEPDFLNSLVTGDESWMFEYDPESKRQSCAWHTKSSLRPKKARMSKSRIKTMIIVFFDIRGIVHCEFVPQGQTVNSAFYLEVLRRLKRRIASVRTDIKDTVKLHHDNATSHTAFIITNFLAQSNTPVIPHPPYSPDLDPCDFFMFPRLKREMKRKH